MDALFLKTGISGIAPAISISGCSDVRPNPSQMSAVGRSTGEKSPQKSVFSRFSFSYPLKFLWPGGNGNNRYNGLAIDDSVLVENQREGKAAQEDSESETVRPEDQNENWVLKILQVKSIWTGEKGNVEHGGIGDELGSEEKGVANDIKHGSDGDEEEIEEEECDACRVPYDDEEDIKFDRDSFSRMLRRVSLAEVKLYAQISYLGNLAYCIPKIKPGNLLKNHGMRFVTSSIKKRELATAAETREVELNEKKKGERKEKCADKTSASEVYQIAASAASYLHAQTRSILPFKFSKTEVGEASVEGSIESIDDVNMINTEMASLKATTDSVTAVVAAEEEVKQAVAEDLSSTRSSPCEWFVCDDDLSGTRYFVIQGSETLASWLANLFFEPIQFEEMGVRVHRGIYEAAKGMYQQMLPEVRAHLKSQGSRATFRFTGHSLGGSLAMLVNLMLLIRGEVPISSLLPVVAFGAPSIMCGGDRLLHKLGLPRSHIRSIIMHRDIVPRAFSCNYDPVSGFLKAINRKFRSHICLNNEKILFGPMGELLILQPSEKFSPEHHLLPSGSGLYILSGPMSDSNDADKQLRTALLLFLNTPHPLEILRHRSAYGDGGTIQRDHDMNSYLKSLRTVIRQQLNSIRKAEREHRRKLWWPLVMPVRIDTGIVVRRSMVSVNIGQDQSAFSGILQTGRESLKRFTRLVASQHMHLLVLLLFPARLLLVGKFNISNLR